jgi:putative peptide zinc metalloprotease protein
MTTTTGIPWRKRDDLLVLPQGSRWVVKDPIAQRYFHLGAEAHFVWTQLTGRRSVEELSAAFAVRFAPRSLGSDELTRFLAQLARQGLVWSDSYEAGALVEQRRRSRESHERWQGLTNLLAIRFRGIDPDRWLRPITRWCGGLFTPAGLMLGGVFILSALLLAWSQGATFAGRYQAELSRWTVADLPQLALMMAFLKICHELGHAVACQRAGGEVREAGIMLLLGTPCLYCNVSDAWLLPPRRARMLISAAGMWVETLLAAAATWVWWSSHPGPTQTIAAQVLAISGVSTLVFNLNPLLRYDGYFLLADAVDQPNLQARAQDRLTAALRGMLGFVADDGPAAETGPWWLPWYGAASWLYRMAVLFTVLWLLDRWLEPQGLRLVSFSITGVTLFGLAWGSWKRWVGSRGPATTSRWAHPFRALIAMVLLLAGLLIPWPARITTEGRLMPATARGVYVTRPGQLSEIIVPGAPVQAGTVIATLTDPELARERLAWSGSREQARRRVTQLTRRQLVDPEAALQLPAAIQQLEALEQQGAQLRDDADRLILRAPQAGRLWPAPRRPTIVTGTRLGGWSGSVFATQNVGCRLETGTLIGWVGANDRQEVVAWLPQAEIDRVRLAQTVTLFPQTAVGPYRGTIMAVAQARADVMNPEVGPLMNRTDPAGGSTAPITGTWYEVRIAVEGLPHDLPCLSTTPLAIHTAPLSTLDRLRRWWRSNFRFA